MKPYSPREPGSARFDRYVLERSVDAHVVNLRRKLGDDPNEPRYVQTVYGRGYRLAEPRS